MTMKLLLLGSNGQIGNEIKTHAQRHNMDLIACDRKMVDITHVDDLLTQFKIHPSIDVVINAAAYTAVDQAESEPDLAFAVNATAVAALANICKQHDVPLIHLSTDYVFDGCSESPYLENDTPNPINTYGKSKLAGEQVLLENWHKSIILRVSWVFGRHGNNFVKTILRLAKTKKTLDIVSDQTGHPTPARDIARVILEIANAIINQNAHWGVFHYCGAPQTHWHAFADKIVSLAKTIDTFTVNTIRPITTAQYPTAAHRPMYSSLDTTKIAKLYNIKQHSWEPYLKDVIEEVCHGKISS